MEDHRYPIGTYASKPITRSLQEEWISDIRFLPVLLENAVLNLDEVQLRTPYRDGGWTVQQVVHHVADSHMNAYIRFKLGFTEDKPVIRPYEEKLWAELRDVEQVPVNVSLTLLHALHRRWHEFLTSFTDKDWEKTVVHPDHQQPLSLWYLLGMYSWHGRHHTAHVTQLRERMKW